MKKIKAVVLDVDGTLTDAKKYYFSVNGETKIAKSFSVRDGKGIDLSQKSGIEFCIVTADKWELIVDRAKQLNVNEVFYNIHDKISVVQDFCNRKNFQLDEICFIGDDVNDIPLLKIVGLPCCVGDAVSDVKEVCWTNRGIIAKHHGGNGAVREILDKIIKMNEEISENTK